MVKEIRISLLGHRDHGKSTLIGRLLHDTGSITRDRIDEAKKICRDLGKEFELAFLLDSFVEERQDGFTLDTTIAQARFNGVVYNLIDVPGHRELVQNMLSGASMADAAILIVSAQENEGLQDETRLHIYLARLLGITKLVVAINKMDTADNREQRFTQIKAGMTAVLNSFGFDNPDIEFVPISARAGDNVMSRSEAMDWYKGRILIECMESFAHGNHEAMLRRMPARMFVQDVYAMDGEPILVGRIESGCFRKDQEIEIYPPGKRMRICALKSGDGKSMTEANAGQNIGMVVENADGMIRGALCMESGRAARSLSLLRVRIFCLPGAELEVGQHMELICGPRTVTCRLGAILEKRHPIKDDRPHQGSGTMRIGPSEAADAEIETDNPLALDRFADVPPTGRFVLAKNGKIIAAGVVL